MRDSMPMDSCVYGCVWLGGCAWVGVLGCGWVGGCGWVVVYRGTRTVVVTACDKCRLNAEK